MSNLITTAAEAETAAWTEYANRDMEGLEMDALGLVVAASTHRLNCGTCPDRARTELYLRVAVDRLHELAMNDPAWIDREDSWARVLDGLASSALRDMLEHAETLLTKPNPTWTVLQWGAARIWIERLTCELAVRENEAATV